MDDSAIQLTRETFGNIPPSSVVAFYIMAVVSMLVFVWGVWRRWKLWQQGRPISFRQILTGNFQRLKPRLGRLFKEGLGQKRVRGRGLASWAHIMMFAGFMMLFLGTTLLEIDHLAAKISERFSFHHGWYYVVYEATLDVFGLLFIVGICLFAWRRMRRPNSIGHRSSDWTALYLFFAIGVTGYLVEGLRIVWDKPEGLALWCSPVGACLAKLFGGMSESTSRSAHLAVWWIHAAMSFGFFAMIPFTRLLHFITGPMNLFLATPTLGQLKPITIEEVEEPAWSASRNFAPRPSAVVESRFLHGVRPLRGGLSGIRFRQTAFAQGRRAGHEGVDGGHGAWPSAGDARGSDSS